MRHENAANSTLLGCPVFGVHYRFRAIHYQVRLNFERILDCESDSRSLYFCEHGLSQEEINDLFQRFKTESAFHSIEDLLSVDTYLCLIVSATEVGYEYLGNGTDFWPRLESAINYQFDFDKRNRLSDWFEEAARTFRGMVPGNSDWEAAFCHIAWPITHAVAAKDIRRPFASSLRGFRGSIDEDDEQILRRLRSVHAGLVSRRYQTWLTNQALVAGIVRDLLNGPTLTESGLLSADFRERLIRDLRDEPEISCAVRIAARNQRMTSPWKSNKVAAKKQTSQTQTDSHYGNYLLRKRLDGQFELLAQLPEMPISVRQVTRRLHRSRKWRPRPWGFEGSAALPRNVVSSRQGTFVVDLTTIQRIGDDQAFFPELNVLEADHDTQEWLQSVRFPSIARIPFFPIDDLDDVSDAIVSRTPHQGWIWVVHSTSDEPPTDVRSCIGEHQGAQIDAVKSEDPQIREWLGWPSLTSKPYSDSGGVKVVAPTPLRIDENSLPVFSKADVIAVETSANSDSKWRLNRGGEQLGESTWNGVGLLQLTEQGHYELRIQPPDGTQRSFSFLIEESLESDIEPPWEVRLLSMEGSGDLVLTRRDLFNGRLVLEVIGSRVVESLSIGISLSPGSHQEDIWVDTIPHRIPANHPVWKKLVQKISETALASNCDLELTISVAGQFAGTWLLEADSTNLWWEHSGTWPRAVSDSGEFQVESRSLIDGQSLDGDRFPVGEPILSVALDEEGSPWNYHARLSLQGSSAWPATPPKPSHLLRELDSHPGAMGLRPIVINYLQLANASSTNLLAEFHRAHWVRHLRNWIIEICCGEYWSRRQNEFETIEEASAMEFWWGIQHNFEFILPPRSVTDAPVPAELPLGFPEQFSHHLPESWWDGAFDELTIDDATRLDPIFATLVEDPNIYSDTDALNQSLREANRSLNGAHLADLVIPITGGDELLEWSLTDLTLSELSTGFGEWTEKYLRPGRGRQRWSQDELCDWLRLLLYPEQLRNRPWESLLPKLLADRPVARAGAFIAWRVDQVARLNLENLNLAGNQTWQ